jgi:hypothetical protein
VDLFAESPLVTAARSSRLGRAGLALPSAIFALVALGVLVAGLFSIADLSAKAVHNRQSAARATQVAEAGLAHGLGALRGSLRKYHFTRILRGFDNLPVATLDDGRITGYGLPMSEQIPDSGTAIHVGTFSGKYYITLVDDDMDPDGNTTVVQKLTDVNGLLLARCRGETADGAVAEIEAIVGAVPFPGIAVDGDLDLSGTPQIGGACGGAHANGNLSASDNTVIETRATATGMVSGNPRLPLGGYTPKLGGQPPIDIPDLKPLDHCATADYRLRSDGFVVVAATGQVLDATSVSVFGWKRSAAPPEVKWDLSGDQSADGTFCVEGNAKVSGNTGSAAAPRKMSIIATGSIEVSGNPYLTPEDDDGIMLLAGGDVSISGNPDAGSDNFQGLVYAGAQCKLSGNPSILGNIACANGPQPAGSVNITSTHDVSGNFALRFDCSATVFNKRRVLSWYPKVGV